ncbi:Glutamine transport system permease protein GlnP [Candidatus Clavichlamydia salmonicola]|uniref:amino acid ABC transporter permease n=1 Tax=Candidatus Clavichlamydia salmonicola TaxID=469812 RepID=UPI00189153D1|nr:amino acid ABC transporter permease [Candidatus Clavichlamydia salmonicola]MBF5051174.1 Glutamine transport system permease protein GlnP [Candidatus Clavichlamydia salmonicola]
MAIFSLRGLDNIYCLLQGAALTIMISATSIIIGLILGCLIGIIRCNQVKKKWIDLVFASYVTLIRGTPLFIQILIIYFGLPVLIGYDISPLIAGIGALSINSSAYLAEIIRGGIDDISLGQWEAAQLLGYSLKESLMFIILPQTFKKILPSLGNELIALIKESSILMVLGVPELTKTSKDIVAREFRPFEIYTMTAFLYLFITSILAKGTSFFEKRKPSR